LKFRKTFSNRLTTRYLLIVRNEEDFAEKSTFTFTYAKLILFIVSFSILIFIGSLFLVSTLLEQWFDPRYAQAESNRRLIELSMTVDSLEQQVQKKQSFITSFQQIVRGDSITDNESYYIANAGDRAVEKEAIRNPDISEVDSQFRQEFEEDGVELLTVNSSSTANQLDELFFFTPLTGIISSSYNPKIGHYGVDVVSKKNEPIKSVADGTVILASWTQDAGYVITVQHKSNVISVYKHNSSLLKKPGDFINAGDVIAIIGNTGELTSGPHLHFELWYNGNPVDPEEFVSF
jgi:murein DD-endopeptidase MepM/ murein hydrolase activator NlpD